MNAEKHSPAVVIADQTIGRGHVFVLAEAGINHDGDVAKAHKLIDAAADAGADGVKFQNYRTEDFVADRTLTYEYGQGENRVVQTQYEMFKERELPTESLRDLREHARERSLAFISTPTSEDGVQVLVDIGADAIKNGSDYLVHLPLLRAMGRTGLPTIVSTGMSTLAEIDDAVGAYVEAGGRDLVILHCTSQYPTPPEDVNLLRIPALATAFARPVGFSDHTAGTHAAAAAVAVGAVLIEKHFTLDKSAPGPDHWFSLDPDELSSLVNGVREVEAALGSSRVEPTSTETRSRRDFGLSCAAARDLSSGDLLRASDVTFSRPGAGIAPRNVDLIVGRTLRQSMRAGQVFTIEDFA